jgi:TolA-binding protein
MRAAQQPAKSTSTSTTTASSATVSSQVSTLLDKSIEKCAKVISVYPKSKWVDDAIFLLGACHYQKHEYDKSIQKFNELNMYYPKSPLIPRAQFLTGMCYFGKNEYDQSSQILERVLKEYPHFEDRETALYTLGEASFEKKKYVEALPYYRLVAGNKKSKLYLGTLSRIGECYFEIAKYDSARTSFSAVVAGSRDDEQVLDALIKIGDSYASEKNFDATTKSYEKTLGLAKEFGKAAVVRLKMASVVAQNGDYKKAIEMYQSVVDEFSRTIQASEAQFRIGYIYEVNLEDFESASAAYDKVKEHSSRSEFASLAALRSKGVAKLKEFSRAVETSEGEKAAESAFLIAELSLFQLGKPDKAIEKYLSVERDFPTTSFAPKSAYAAAYVFLSMKQDTASAVEVFKRIIERFPNSAYAAAAREVLAKGPGAPADTLRADTLRAEASRVDTLRADTLRNETR